MKNAAGDSFKWVDVSAERFPGWIESFARRHGDSGSLAVASGAGAVTFTAPDGAAAACHPPFVESFATPAASAGQEASAGHAEAAEAAAAVAAHARAPRTVGVLLVRLGGYAAGVFAGYPPALADSKVGSRPVHGRSAAGGWSQQRFSRRREKQANEALAAAADTAAAVFGRWMTGITASGAPAHGNAAIGHGDAAPAHGHTAPAHYRAYRGTGGDQAGRARSSDRRGPLDAVVLGGDKRAVAELRGDPRLAAYFAIATERFLTVPDPKRAVLEGTPKLFTSVRIRLTESCG